MSRKNHRYALLIVALLITCTANASQQKELETIIARSHEKFQRLVTQQDAIAQAKVHEIEQLFNTKYKGKVGAEDAAAKYINLLKDIDPELFTQPSQLKNGEVDAYGRPNRIDRLGRARQGVMFSLHSTQPTKQ